MRQLIGCIVANLARARRALLRGRGPGHGVSVTFTVIILAAYLGSTCKNYTGRGDRNVQSSQRLPCRSAIRFSFSILINEVLKDGGLPSARADSDRQGRCRMQLSPGPPSSRPADLPTDRAKGMALWMLAPLKAPSARVETTGCKLLPKAKHFALAPPGTLQ